MWFAIVNALLLESQRVWSLPSPGDIHIHVDGKDLKDNGIKVENRTRTNKGRYFAVFPVEEAESESEDLELIIIWLISDI